MLFILSSKNKSNLNGLVFFVFVFKFHTIFKSLKERKKNEISVEKPKRLILKAKQNIKTNTNIDNQPLTSCERIKIIIIKKNIRNIIQTTTDTRRKKSIPKQQKNSVFFRSS